MADKIKIVPLPDDESYHYWEAFEKTYAIQYGDGTYCFLLEGDERALLIDTVYGRGDFPNILQKLTDKPIILVNTHGHYDHTGGNFWFPKALMHPNAAPEAKHAFGPVDEAFFANFPYPDYEIETIDEGYVFDLGGRKVEVLHTPAHSEGSLSFIDHKCRLLFCGDEFDSGQANLRDLTAVRQFLHNMQRLKTREGEYDFIMPSHNGCPITKRYLDDFITNAQDILAGNPHLVPIEDAPGYSEGMMKTRIRSRVGLAAIIYHPVEHAKGW